MPMVPGTQKVIGVDGKAPSEVTVPSKAILALKSKLIGMAWLLLPPIMALNRLTAPPTKFPVAALSAALTPFITLSKTEFGIPNLLFDAAPAALFLFFSKKSEPMPANTPLPAVVIRSDNLLLDEEDAAPNVPTRSPLTSPRILTNNSLWYFKFQ